MQSATTSRTSLWAGRIISGLIALSMTFDGGMKVLKAKAAVEGTVKLGFSENVLVPLGIVALLSTALYVFPRTSTLGAILLTGFLGGATATNVRTQPQFTLFPVVLGVLAWLGLYLRDPSLRKLIPLRASES
ncbi:MAG TPA: DoxX family protein [Terriglobales bacterium]|nr:DoxX family protein [Terriglobales bacterium]